VARTHELVAACEAHGIRAEEVTQRTLELADPPPGDGGGAVA